MMFINVVFWTMLGLYLDQIIPSQFGVAKPWNFLCKSAKKKILADDDEEKLIDNENHTQDIKNFEPVADALKKQEPTG